jgi:surface antigen
MNGLKAFTSRGPLILLLAAELTASGHGALATPADAIDAPAAIVSPAVYDFAATEQSAAATARYQTGAYFYGNDCGGNSVLSARARRTNAPGGVILNGDAGRQIAQMLNCDDRRSALPSYRDAFQGKLGQAYSWRNPNGGASGDITAVRRYQDGAASCTSFRATATVNQQTTGNQGTACRQPDGNWHTL